MSSPRRLALWIWCWSDQYSPPAAPGVQATHFQQPGIPQGRRARPRPTPNAPYLSSQCPQDMSVLRGVSSLVSAGPSKLEVSAAVRRSGTTAELVDSAGWQYVGRTDSNLGSMCQSCAAESLTVRPAFLHYGCCGPYGGIGAVLWRLLRWQLSRNFPGTTSTSSSSTDIDNMGQLSQRRKVCSSP